MEQTLTLPPTGPEPVSDRSRQLLADARQAVYRRTDQLFGWLMAGQWLAGILIALWVSPRAWAGLDSQIHWHVWAAAFFGGLIVSFPLLLIWKRPGWVGTRHAIAVAQMLTSALLIHLMGGRSEAHFHIFGSLAFLACYRDWRVLATATSVVALDHFLRGAFWPQSIFAMADPHPWRWIEHVAWVLFEDAFLVISIRQSLQEMAQVAVQRSRLEETNGLVERRVVNATGALKSALRDLREQEKLLRIVTDNAEDLIAVVDAGGCFLYNSPSYQRVLGTSPDVHGKTFYSQLHPDDRMRAAAAFQACLRTGLTQVLECRMRAKSGAWLDFEAHCSANFQGGEGFGSRVVVARDITQRKADERERERMEIQLRHGQKLEAIGQLAAGIAHEINTPAQFISDNTRFVQAAFEDIERLLARYDGLLHEESGRSPALAARVAEAAVDADLAYLREEVPRAIRQSLEGLGRVTRIVRAMKDFSHPGTNELAPVDLNAAIDSAVTVARNEWKYVAVVKTEFDASLTPVPCYPGEFGQVVLNLLVNAAHAIGDKLGKDSTEKGVITLSTRRRDGVVEMRVSDTGTGIPEAHRDRVFDPFFTTKAVGRGTGQGLAIAHAVIVEKHGGTIHFETETGSGTTFVIRLPLTSLSMLPKAA